MGASANLMSDIIKKLSQPPSNPKSDFGKLAKYVDDNPMVKAAIRNNLTTDEEVLNMLRYAGPSLDENGTPRDADDPQVVKDFEAYKKFKSMAQDYLDRQEKKKISRKINYQEFRKKVWNSWNKVSKWETSLSNKMLNTIKKIIPTEIDDAILKIGNKANDFTDAAVDKVTDFVTKRINRKIEELKAKEKEIGGKQSKTMKEKGKGKGNSKLNHNHNEWYLRFKGDNLAPLNYYDAVDEFVEFKGDSIKSLTPLVMRIPLQLVIPNDTKYLARLNQAFTADLTSLLNARGYGYTEYDSKDIGNYILNTRYAIALLAVAIRQLKVYSNYNTLNIMEPDLLIAAHNTSHYTKPNIQIERNMLTSLKERVRLGIEMLKTITAGAMPLYDRTLFLLSNFFKDSKSNKSCYFMFDLDADEEDGVFTYIYTIGNSSSLSTETVSLPDIRNVSDILNTFDKLVDRCFIGDYKAKQIRSDINYLYGVTGSTYYTKYFEEAYKSINQPLKILDDEKILLQIHNMRFNPRLVMTHSKTGNHATYAIFTGATRYTLYALPGINTGTHDVYGTASKKMDITYNKVNAWKKLSADDLVSVTRFVNLPKTKLEFSIVQDPNEASEVVIKSKFEGTIYEGKFENAIGLQVITYNPAFTGTNNQFNTEFIISAGNILTPVFFDMYNSLYIDYKADFAKWSWSYADWMPHAKISVKVACSDSDDEQIFQLISLSANDNYRILHDLDMCADISPEQLDPIDQVAMLSELIWSQNGSSIIDTTKAKQAKSSKSSKDYRNNTR